MPLLTIQLPQKQFNKARARAKREGFKSPAEWAKILVSRYIAFEESPKLKSSKIIEEMRKTGLYPTEFLNELRHSLKYADKTAQ